MFAFEFKLIVTEKFQEEHRPEDEVEVLTESESEEEDPANESMEPSFKREDINRSRLLQLSILDDATNHDSTMNSKHENTVDSDNYDSVVEKSEDTLKDVDDSRNDTHFTIGDNNQTSESYHDVFDSTKVIGKDNETLDASVIVDCNKNASVRGTYFVTNIDKNEQTLDQSNFKLQQTSFVRNFVMNNTSKDDCSIKNYHDSKNISIDSDKSNTNMMPQTVKKNPKTTRASEISSTKFKELEMATKTRSLPAPDAINVSLPQFEQMEIDANTSNLKTNDISDVSLAHFGQTETATNTGQLKTIEQSKMATYTRPFKASDAKDDSLVQFEQIETATNTGQLKATHANDVALAQFEQSKMATITKRFQVSDANDISLAEFEKLELAANSKKQSMVKDTSELLANIKISKQNRNFFAQNKDLSQLNLNRDKTYFDIDANTDNKLDESKKILLDDRSPSIVKEDIGNYELSTIKHLLGESFSRSDIVSSVHNNFLVPTSKKQASVDVFEDFDSPIVMKLKDKSPLKPSSNNTIELLSKSTEKRKFFNSMLNENSKPSGSNLNAEKIDNAKDTILSLCIEKVNKEVEVTRKCIEEIVLDKTDSKSKFVTSIFENAKSKSIMNQNEADIYTSKQNNTIDEFEVLYKNITLPRATEFDLLVSQNSTMLDETHFREDSGKPKYNLRHKCNTDKKEQNDKSIDKKEKMDVEEILLESRACESRAKPPKRNLRLRRRKNQEDDSTDQEKDKTEHEKDNLKLKDIINLQKEFSDVTMGVPASKKETKDIQSPKKKEEDENNPPLGIQSCPSKR